VEDIIEEADEPYVSSFNPFKIGGKRSKPSDCDSPPLLSDMTKDQIEEE
jgi:hypothetical protein